jgi:PilZ domain
MRDERRGAQEFACTYDIHPRGARLLSALEVKVGEFVTVERGRLKSVCEVVWTGDPNSALRGQFTVACVEGSRAPWEDELRQAEERYVPFSSDRANARLTPTFDKSGQNRRRAPRFAADGDAEVVEIGGQARMEGRLKQISERGCLITAGSLITPGSGLDLVLNICDVTVAVRGNVRYAGEERMGVEFQEIRQGDRPLLNYVLQRLKKSPADEFANLEIVTDSLTAAH